MKVLFNCVVEFLEEIARDRDQVERGIVRVTRVHRHDSRLCLGSVSVVASAVVAGHLIRLERYIGDQLSHSSSDRDQALMDKAEETIGQIVARCRELQLEDRAGLFEL